MKNPNRFKLAISINGEGKGHVTRMIAVAQRLQEKYDLVFWCSLSTRNELERAFPKHRIHSIPALQFVLNNFEVDYIRTTFGNIKKILLAGFTITNLMEELMIEKVEGVISDFEPFLPEAAFRMRLPIIQLNHPGVVTRLHTYALDAFLARIVATRMMSKFDREIICSFFEGDLGPIIRREITSLKDKVKKENYFLVYEKDSFRDVLRNQLNQYNNITFRFFPDPNKDFLSSLINCKGIISSSGHQIISEALYLGKPIFVIPIKNQYEQRLNAEMLKKSGRGSFGYSDDFSRELHTFIQEIDSYPKSADPSIRFRFNDDSEKACKEIVKFFSSYPKNNQPKKTLCEVVAFERLGNN